LETGSLGFSGMVGVPLYLVGKTALTI